MSLPIFKNDDKNFQLMQTGWAQQLNPVISLPVNKGRIIQAVALTTGTNVINHLLGRKLQGWYLTDIDSTAGVYRSAPKSDITLTLTASGNATVDIFVF